VALEVVMEISNMYFESLKGNLLKEVLHHPPEQVICGRDIEMKDRNCFHKCARVLYKFLRCFYVSIIFYFIPFSVMFL
jgi:predicted nucleic acid-binding Zn ribbon protein